MNEGAVQTETGRNTIAMLRQMKAKQRSLERQLSLLVKNSQITSLISAAANAPVLYSSLVEPEPHKGLAFWYKPATGGEAGELYASFESASGTWAWRGPIWYG